MSLGEHICIGDLTSTTRKAFILWKEKVDSCIMDETIKMCEAHGVTDLYMLDRDFILDTIREKMEREAQP